MTTLAEAPARDASTSERHHSGHTGRSATTGLPLSAPGENWATCAG